MNNKYNNVPKDAHLPLNAEDSLIKFLQTSTEPTWVHNLYGKIELFNPAAEQLLGYQASAIIGQDISILFPSNYARTYKNQLLLKEPPIESADPDLKHKLNLRHKNKSRLTVHFSINIFNVNEQNFYIVLARNISQQIENAKKLQQNETRLQTVIDTAVDAIITIDPHAKIQSFNPAATKLFGYQQSEVLGKNINMLMPEPYHSQHDNYLKDYRATRKKMIIGIGREVQAKHKSGQIFPVHLSVSECTVDGITYFTGIIHDISDLKEIELKLQLQNKEIENNSKKQQCIIAMHEIIQGNHSLATYLKNILKIICLHTNACCGSFYLIKNEKLNWYAGHAIQTTSPEMMKLDVGQGILGSSVLEGEVKIVTPPENSIYHIKTSVLTIIPKQIALIPIAYANTPIGLIELSHLDNFIDDDIECLKTMKSSIGMIINGLLDKVKIEKLLNESQIHTEKLLEQEKKLIESQKKAQFANKAKTNFLSNMSHEMRTPLNSIIGHAELLLADQNLDKETHNSLKQITTGSEHLLSLVNQALDLEKIESGNMELSIEKIDLCFILNDSIDIIRPMAKKKKISINVQYYESIEVNADYFRLKQVFINLLSNAVKYNKTEGSIHISTCIASHNFAAIKIEDTGQGLSESEIQKIFTPFERGKFANSDIEGSGIGLVISKKLLRLMDGDIAIKSSIDQGSTFTVQLPISEVTTIKEINKNNITHTKKITLKTPLLLNKSNHRILVADDNPANRIIISKQLSTLGVTAEIVENGEESLKKLEQNTYDLVLMDCNMPILDGYATTKKFRELEQKNQHLPIIAFTADAFLERKITCFESGMDDFLTKPVSISNLRQKLYLWLEFTDLNVLNLDEIHQYVGDDKDAAIQILHHFISNNMKITTSCLAAYKGKAIHSIAEIAHKVKSSAKSIGAFRLAQQAEQIENDAKNGKWVNIKESFLKFVREYCWVSNRVGLKLQELEK